eukprot:7378833-Prymnesium_polylepis.1
MAHARAGWSRAALVGRYVTLWRMGASMAQMARGRWGPQLANSRQGNPSPGLASGGDEGETSHAPCVRR